jgi:hypothetical protein
VTHIELRTLVGRSDKLLYAEIGSDVTIMSVQSGRYYSLTKVGARIWSLIENATPVERICEQLLAEYRIDREHCENDVLKILHKMAEEGLVTVTANQS